MQHKSTSSRNIHSSLRRNRTSIVSDGDANLKNELSLVNPNNTSSLRYSVNDGDSNHKLLQSVSELTMDQNLVQSHRFYILSKKFQELNHVQSQLEGNHSVEEIEALNQSFVQVAEEIRQIYNDYKNEKIFVQNNEVDPRKKRGKKKQQMHNETMLEDDESGPGQRNTEISLIYTNSIQQKVSERLSRLFNDPVEFENLEREIFEYEKKYGIVNKIKSKFNKIEENKRRIQDFNERREEILEESFRIREERNERSKMLRVKAQENHALYTSQLSKTIDDKLERASERKRQFQEDIITTERKLKWSYLISFWVRMLILIGRLEDERRRRAAEEKQQRLTKVVYTRMMPIVWKRRSERWQTCWAAFNRHWTFFQLWVTIKKKKNAARMIRSFLDETQSSMKLVRQVHIFKERIRKCQEYLKQYSVVYEARMMSLLLQYTIVESKLIVDEPISSSEKTVKSDEKVVDRKVISPQHSNSSSTMNTPKGPRPNSKKKGRPPGTARSKHQNKKAFLYMEPKDMIADSLSLVRPSLQMRLELLREVYIQRREAYKKELSEYSTVLGLYKQKYRQFVHYQRAQAILKNEEVDNLDSEVELSSSLFNPFEETTKKELAELIDENGNVIPRPKEPFFSVFMSEEEMLEVVMRGFQRVRDQEEEDYSKLSPTNDEDEKLEPNEEDIIRYENKHLKSVMRVFQELKNYFGDSVLEPYNDIFKRANLAANDSVKERRELKAILKRKRSKSKAKKATA